MDSNVVAAVVSGLCSIVSAFGAVYLKEYLNSRKARSEALRRQTMSIDESTPPVDKEPAKPPVTATHKRGLFKRPIIIVVGGLVFGMITRALHFISQSGRADYAGIVALVVLFGLTGAFAIFHRKRGFQLAFQLENLALWSGWVSGWSIIHGHVWGDVLAVIIPCWLICAVVGGLIVSLRRKSDARQVAPADG